MAKQFILINNVEIYLISLGQDDYISLTDMAHTTPLVFQQKPGDTEALTPTKILRFISECGLAHASSCFWLKNISDYKRKNKSYSAGLPNANWQK